MFSVFLYKLQLKNDLLKIHLVFLLLKYILESVVNKANGLNGMISALDNRVKTINNEIVRLDALICHALGVKPDTRRLSAADGKEDARKD